VPLQRVSRTGPGSPAPKATPARATKSQRRPSSLATKWSIVNRVLRMLRAGKTPADIAEETGVPTRRVQQVAMAAGLTKRTSVRRPHRTRVDYDRVLRLVRAGKSRIAIAAEAGVSLWTVTQARKTVGPG
jgi:DNA-binding CsgD family transcriptional regulator